MIKMILANFSLDLAYLNHVLFILIFEL